MSISIKNLTQMKGYVQTNSIIRRKELVCLEFDISGKCSFRRLTRSDLLKEARESLREEFGKLQNIYSELFLEKSYDEFPFNALNDKDKRGLLQFFRGSLQGRDIRQVDPAFSGKPALWVRHNAILVSLEQIRGLILYNKLFSRNVSNATDNTRVY